MRSIIWRTGGPAVLPCEVGARPWAVLRTLGRATRVLDLFTVDGPEWGATAVAGELEIAKSQAHELLISLSVGGLLQRVGAGRYRLGWRIAALNAVLVETSDLLRLAGPEMRALVGSLRRDGSRRGLGRATGVRRRALGRLGTAVAPFRVGEDLPADSTALGKVLLAGRPRDEIEAVPDPREDVEEVAGRPRAGAPPRDSPTRSRSSGGDLLRRRADHQPGRGCLRVARDVRPGRPLGAGAPRLSARRGRRGRASRALQQRPAGRVGAARHDVGFG